MWPYMAVPPEDVGQSDFRVPAIAVGVQVNLLVVDKPPETFNKKVRVATLLS